MRLPPALCAILLVAGCATLSEDECRAGNWDEIGFRDGTQGRMSSFVQQHAKACEKVGVVPDAARWDAGRKRGLRAYCTPSKAFSEGQSGRSLNPVCPASQIATLEAANDRGWRYFRLGNEIGSLRADIRSLEDRLVKEDDAAARGALLARVRLLEARILVLETRRGAIVRA